MEDIKKSLTKLTKTITKTSGEMLKTTKLAMNISNHEDKLNSIYLEIGKKVHEIYMYGGSVGKFFDEKYKEIEEVERQIKELKEELDTVKGTKTCPKCGKSGDRNAEFCPGCGSKMDACVADSDNCGTEASFLAAPDDPKEIKPSVKCRICGTENDENTKFCISCGRLL